MSSSVGIDSQPVLGPATALRGEPIDRNMWIGGLITMSVAHGAPLLIYAVVVLLEAMGIVGGAEPPPPPPRHIVEARFVQLGKPPEPEKLPQRKVPVKSTVVDQRTVVSQTPREPPPEPKKKEPPPPDPVEDLLQRVGDRAHAFSEIAERKEKEGHPDGIEGGTETDTAKAGDLYIGQLYALFRRGWSVPTTIEDKELQTLTATVAIEISHDCRIQGVRLVRASSNPLFDQSVLDRVNEVQSYNTKLPEPPPEIAGDFLGQTISVRFLGRNAR